MEFLKNIANVQAIDGMWAVCTDYMCVMWNTDCSWELCLVRFSISVWSSFPVVECISILRGVGSPSGYTWESGGEDIRTV